MARFLGLEGSLMRVVGSAEQGHGLLSDYGTCCG